MSSFCLQVSLLRVIKDLEIPILAGNKITYHDTFKSCVRRVLAGVTHKKKLR